MAGAPAIRPRSGEPAEAGGPLRHGRHDREPLRGVVDREADHQERAQRQRSHRVCRADRKALPQVVKADRDRDQHRHVGAASAGRSVLPAALQPCLHPAQQQVRREPAQEHEGCAAEGLRALARDVDALQGRVDREERQQPHGESHQDAQPARVDAPHERQPQHPERDGHDAHVEPEQRHQPVETEIGAGCLHGRRDLVRDGRARRGQELDLVGVPFDPVVVDRDLRGVEMAQLRVGGREVGEAVVHDHLRDRHVVRAVVAHGEVDAPRLEHGPLHGQVLDRRALAVGQPGAVQQRERRQRECDQCEWHGAKDPRRHPPGPAGGAHIGACLHQLTTSNRPIQPSCANSDWWAWNMYWPSYGKRSSRMPRCPWHCMIVSVYSTGSSEVPVG